MKNNLILNIPHSSIRIPDEYRHLFKVDLTEELRVMTDWYTDELFCFDSERVIAPTSRLLVDTERFRCDKDEEMARFGMGAVYTLTHDGRTLKSFTSLEREALLKKCYDPHHENLERATENALREEGYALIVDCHSFSSVPLKHESSKSTPRPDICIGTDSFHTPSSLSSFAYDFFRSRGYSVSFDSPFSGTITPMRYYRKNKNVHSIMIEVNRSIYMNEYTTRKTKDFDRVRADLLALLNFCSLFPFLGSKVC